MAGNAKIEGLLEDLNMSGTQYNVALAIFFIPYVLFGMASPPIPKQEKNFFCPALTNTPEVPSNILLGRFRPSVYIGILTLGWGTIMTLTGVVQNFSALCAMRFLLGVFE